jgi:aminoglycoside phosphotransferase
MTGLAFDPAVPCRDALLARPGRLHVKYRFGESLRVVYRRADGLCAARSFPPGTSAGHHARALAAAGDPRAVVHLPELHAVLWAFPHDRKLAALPRLADPASLLPGCVETRVVAYAAERSATVECRDADGFVLGFAKLAGPDEVRLTRRVAAAVGADHPELRVPSVLAADDDVLVMEALAGRRLDALGSAALQPLGAALAALHGLRPAARPAPFTRLDPERLATAAAVIARARPDVAGRAARLLARLEDAAADARRRPVCLHGDANLRNAILLGDGRVGLIDLEHVSAGPAAADLGQLLAGLLARPDRRAASAALLAGYARVAAPPDRAALRWHTAASVLARVALPAVGRVRPATLARLGALLDAAAGLVATRTAVAA